MKVVFTKNIGSKITYNFNSWKIGFTFYNEKKPVSKFLIAGITKQEIICVDTYYVTISRGRLARTPNLYG